MWGEPRRREVLAGLLATGCCGLTGSGPLEEGPDGSTLTEHELAGRRYLLFRPRPKAKQPMPLLLALHARGSSGTYFIKRMELGRFGEDFPFVVVAPDGTCSPGSEGKSCAWNSGNSIAGLEGGADDVRHLGRVLDAVAAQVPIDERRVFAFGFSNGAKMAYRLAAETERLAGIGVVCGSIGGRATSEHPEHRSVPTKGGRAVHVLHIHGLDDTVVPPFPEEQRPSAKGHTEVGVRESVGVWIRHNRTQPRLPERLPRDATWRSTDGRDGSRVHVRLVSGRAHDWTREDLSSITSFLSEI